MEEKRMTIDEVYEMLKRKGYYEKEKDNYQLTINGSTTYYNDLDTMLSDLEYYQGIKIEGIVEKNKDDDRMIGEALNALDSLGVQTEQEMLNDLNNKLRNLSRRLDSTRMNGNLRKEYQQMIIDCQCILEEIDGTMDENVYYYRNVAIESLERIKRKNARR